MRRLLVLAVAGLALVVAAVIVFSPVQSEPGAPVPVGVKVPAGAPLPMLQDIDPEDLDPKRDVPGVPPIAIAPPGGAVVQPGGLIRIPKPTLPAGPRRVGIQVGHWQTDEVPAEYGSRIVFQTGTSWGGVKEVDVNMDIAKRIRAKLVARGFVVDILPTTVPVGYVADVFLALHADGDGLGEKSGFKIAHAARRGPYEDKLVSILQYEYGKETGMDVDPNITRAMSAYYAFNWGRYQHAAAPHTPAAILEMGFLSSDDDRAILVDQPNLIAGAITNGIIRFLAEVPQSKVFESDLLVPTTPIRTFPPSPSPTG